MAFRYLDFFLDLLYIQLLYVFGKSLQKIASHMKMEVLKFKLNFISKAQEKGRTYILHPIFSSFFKRQTEDMIPSQALQRPTVG